MSAAITTQPRSKAAQNKIGRPVHEHQEGMRDGHEDVHGAGDGKSYALSTLQSQRFGNKFSQDDERISNGKKRQRRGKSVGVNTSIRNVAEPWSNHRSQRAFTHPAKTKAGQGDAKLYGWKEFIEVLLNFADSTC